MDALIKSIIDATNTSTVTGIQAGRAQMARAVTALIRNWASDHSPADIADQIGAMTKLISDINALCARETVRP